MEINLDRGTINLVYTKSTLRKKGVPYVASFKQRLIILAVLAILSIAAWAFYFSQGLTLAYNDARSHLNVARRVVDSLQPGFAQIGSIWLPLYHVLEFPFIWNEGS